MVAQRAHASDSYHQMVHWNRSRDERESVLVVLLCRYDQRPKFCDWAHRKGRGSEADAVRNCVGGERIRAAEYADSVETDFSGGADACALHRGRVWWRLCDGI